MRRSTRKRLVVVVIVVALAATVAAVLAPPAQAGVAPPVADDSAGPAPESPRVAHLPPTTAPPQPTTVPPTPTSTPAPTTAPPTTAPPSTVPPSTVPPVTTTPPPTTSPPTTTPPPTTPPPTTRPPRPSTTVTTTPPVTTLPSTPPSTPTPGGGTTTSTGTVAVTSDGSVTAAETFGWGAPLRAEEFNNGTGLGPEWNVYDGPGHAGNGRRSPAAVRVGDGMLTITGDAAGTTAGMAWLPGAKYGRWEGRMRAPASDPSYNALMLLWPDAEDFPVGGEVDFVEMLDHTRQTTDLFLHYGPDNSQVHGAVAIDGTQWHNWAVEWTPTHIAAFVDGQEWWRTTDTAILPPRAMHLCIQLDWFPEGGPVQPSAMYVDWVRYYPLTPLEATPATPGQSWRVPTWPVDGPPPASPGPAIATTPPLRILRC